MFLMEYYLYPPKHISPAILAALTPPNGQFTEPAWYEASSPELASQKLALNYANARQDEAKRESALAVPTTGWL